MTILRVAIIFDNKARPETTGVYCRRALGPLVAVVEHFLPTELARIPRNQFDVYVNIDDGLRYRLPAELSPSVLWIIDTHLDFDWCLTRARDFDFVFAAQRDGAALLRKHGIASAIWLPLACDPDIHRKHVIAKRYDVCFIGNVFPGERADLLRRIQGRFWNTFVAQLYFEEMAKAYSASRIVFNRSILNDVNMRVLEALACGSLLITNDLRENGQEELLRDGVHLATYGDAEDLLDKIAWYLAHEEARERIAAAGRAEVLARHTYRHRMERLLDTVQQALSKTVMASPIEIVSPSSKADATSPEPNPTDLSAYPFPPSEGGARGGQNSSAPCAPPEARDTGGAARHSREDEAARGSEVAPGHDRSTKDARVAAMHTAPINRGTTTLVRDRSYFEFSRPEMVALIPESARKILDIGCGAGRLGEALKARQPCEVIGIELDLAAAQAARGRLDQLLVGDVEHIDPAFPPACFDVIVCGDVLEHLRDPLRLLRRLRKWLKPSGRLIASIPNVRHHSVLRSLLDGNWTYEPAGLLDRDHLRFFTRREVEKLFHRAGFSIAAMQLVPGPGYDDWVARGRPAEVKIGRLHVAGMPPNDVEEFYTYQFLVSAVPREVLDPGRSSIVIVTHNQIAYTRQCVDSVRERTDEPYELILIDNGSTDGTVEYLRSLADAQVVWNDQNRGFPAAVNQGIRLSTGKQIVLLNNDCVVTTGWLGRMLRALESDPQIGLVGPCSNCVSGQQQVRVVYDELEGLDGFAWDWGKAHDQMREVTDRLVGFCLLIRREVVDAIGLLDERFGLGCFEDDDYCLRALQAGYRAVIARDAFVHHSGGRTFAAIGIDFDALMQSNEKLFREKWRRPLSVGGTAPPVLQWLPRERKPAYALRMAPGGGLVLAPPRILLSACLIVRNNERTIRACLESLRACADEIVVVDTGSTDATPEICAALGARLFHFPWCDDFSAARNESLRHARGEWIFCLDSDDTVDPVNCGKVRQLALRTTDPSLLAFVVQVHCPAAGVDGEFDRTEVDHVKLFRNRPDLRFEGRIHEQVIPAIRRTGGDIAWSDCFVVHSGYDHSPEGQARKRDRDLRLLHLELEERPEHPFTLFNLGMTYSDIGRYEEAVDFLKRSIERSRESESQLRKTYSLLVYSYTQLGRREDAWSVCQRGLDLFPHDAELWFRRGVLLHDLGRHEEAVQAYEKAVAGGEERHFVSIDRGIRGYKTRQNLAVVYADMGDLARAEAQWRQIVEQVPRYRAGWQGLGELLLRQGKFTELLAVAELLLTHGLPPRDAVLLRAQAAAGQGDFETASRQLEQVLVDCPGDVQALKLLCQILFEHGAPAHAERFLRQLIRLEPGDASAYHNLGIVCMRMQQYESAAQAFRRALELRPDAPTTYRYLGYALKEAGWLDEAVAVWRAALGLAPGDPEILEAVRQAGQRPDTRPPD